MRATEIQELLARKPLTQYLVSGLPYYKLVPKRLDENLLFRKEMIRHGQSSKRAAQELWTMSSRDPLFWINTFVWTLDPRPSSENTQRVAPMITYPYQDQAELDMIASTGIIPGNEPTDLAFEKVRDMGGTWLPILSHLWGWSFREMVSYLWVSRNQDLVDKRGNTDTLFWKADLVVKFLPGFLKPPIVPGQHRTMLHLENPETGSVIDGASTTADTSVGGRRTSVFFDEFARVTEGRQIWQSSADVTRCRIVVSTHLGTNNMFYVITRQQDTPKIQVHWVQHPVKSKGLWWDDDGRPRSPWYDAECKRRGYSKRDIAENLDLEPLASGGQFFDIETIERLLLDSAHPPILTGEIAYDDRSGRFRQFLESPGDTGPFKLWVPAPNPHHTYAIGADISTGTGASNSVLVVGDCNLHEVVAEYVVSDFRGRAERFAVTAMAVGYWFNKAVLNWEDNGPGEGFGATLVERGYGNLWLRRKGDITRGISNEAGWYSSPEQKRSILGDLRRAWGAGDLIQRSAPTLEEAKHYVDMGNTVDFGPAQTLDDPSGMAKNHGDRVIATAVMWLAMKDRMVRTEDAAPRIPPNSLAGRRERHKQMMIARNADSLDW